MKFQCYEKEPHIDKKSSVTRKNLPRFLSLKEEAIAFKPKRLMTTKGDSPKAGKGKGRGKTISLRGNSIQ